MSDFLTRLVGRSLGTEPVIRPLLAPQFAAGPEIGMPEPGEPPPVIESHEEAAPVAPQPPAPTSPMETGSPPPETQRTAPLPAPHAGAREPGIRREPVPVPAEVIQVEHVFEQILAHERTLVREVIPAAPRAPASPAASGPPAEPARTAPRIQPAVHAASPEPGERRTAGTPPGRPAKTTVRTEPPAREPLQPAPVPTLPTPSEPPRAAAPPARQAAEETQPVRVTIGRVEIRAVAQPAPPAARKPATPGPSLDEYLRSFTERRR